MSLPLAALWILVSMLFMVTLRYGLLAGFLLRLRFEPGRAVTLPREKMPQAMRQLLDLAAPRLEALGFERSISLATWGGRPSVRNRPVFSDTYFNATSHCHAWVSPAADPERGALYSVDFETCYADGRSLITFNRRSHAPPALPREIVAHNDYSESVEEQWQMHMRRRGECGSNEIVDDPAEAWRRRQRQLASQPSFLEDEGFLRSGPQAGSWRLTLRGTAKLPVRFAPLLRRSGRVRPASSGENASARVLADAVAFTRSLSAATVAPHDWLIKMLLVFGSALLGGQALGVQWSWRIAAAVVVVLAFHESCHFVAMRLCGYRDIGVYSVPMLGAAANGRGDNATLWQRLFVYLAGPLPGIVLGVACIDAAALVEGTLQSWLLPLGAVALGVNLFNLLPFPPLDGGRVVESLVWWRSAHLRPVLVASAVVLLVAGGAYLHTPVAVALGAVFALAMPAEWRISKLAAATRRVGGAVYERKRALPAVFRALMRSGVGAKLDFPRRAESARAVLALVMRQPPRRAHAAAAWFLYAIVLAAPVAAYLAVEPQVRSRGNGVSAQASQAGGRVVAHGGAHGSATSR